MAERESKKGKKQRKWGRGFRKPGALMQARRTYENKLRRVNRDRAKSGKPPLAGLPLDSRAYLKAFARPTKHTILPTLPGKKGRYAA